mmetsp:Transcript_83769/g.233636  ORF Transcript_83769/g.233636 Transcript_83769/m.233636 type:complete len:594 (-) Transcript_83769:119-1900(-)
MQRSASVAELKCRVRELGLEIPPGVVEKSELLAFLEAAEKPGATQGDTRSSSQIFLESLSPSGERSVFALKGRLRELGLTIPDNIVEKEELVKLVEEAERQQERLHQLEADQAIRRTRPKAIAPVPPPWVRKESRSRPGRYYYVNMETNDRTWEPWFRQESRSKRGRFYYYNIETGESTWDAPTQRLKAVREESPSLNGSRNFDQASIDEDVEPPEPKKIDYRDDAFDDCSSCDIGSEILESAASTGSFERRISSCSGMSCRRGELGVRSLTYNETAEDSLETSIGSIAAGSALSDIFSPKGDPAGPAASSSSAVGSYTTGSALMWTRGALLGRGALGRVFKGVDQATGQTVAVKEVQLSNREDDVEFRKSLENEVSIMESLDHPSIVKYLGHDYIDSCFYMYLEYMPGGTLTAALNEFGIFEEDLIRLYAKQILEGLEYLHTREPPVIHRDIKGSNVLLRTDCRAKLADFGCSKRTDQSLTHTVRGSVPWMAPEVIAHSRYGLSADVWSFGCVVIEMGTAAVPWGRFDNQMAALVRIGMSQEIPPLPDPISDDCRDFIMACVQRDAASRQTASQLLTHVFLQKDDEDPWASD